MIIENPDVFKSWLTSILEPLCDADPAALAKYVYALVKKDKPVEELREVMVDQLDVFLQAETKPFVEMLFKSLETNEYLQPREAEKPPTPPPEPEGGHAGGEPDVPPPPPLPPATNGASLEVRAPSPTNNVAPRHRVVVTRAQKHAPRPPLEQTLVKVLPLTELLEEPLDQLPRRRDRRPDNLRDDRRRRRSRSADRRMRPRRHPRDTIHDDVRRRVSRSPSPRGRYRNRSPPPAPGLDRLSRSRSRSPIPPAREHSRERDRARVTREMERDSMSRDREHRERVSRDSHRSRSRERSRGRSRGSSSPRPAPRGPHPDSYKRRCRDFDEKGYCMRGDQCQWDHGNDPVVLEDNALTRVLAMPPPVPEYNPLVPDIWMGAPPGFAPFPPAHLPPPRELIHIPRVRHEVPPPGTLPPAMPPRPPMPHKNFDYNRLGKGPQRASAPLHASNCSLEVKKVPRGLNDITHLNNHFSKFGKIVNIQICFGGDPEAALVTFSTPTEASVAYKSTEAVLNNRFIKVFWHNHDSKQENLAPGMTQGKPPLERPPAHAGSHNKVLINRDNIKATADIKQNNIDKEKEKQANGQDVKKPVAPVVPITPVDKCKRARELLDTQLHQQRRLIQKLECGNLSGQQKSAIMDAIKSTQEGIEKLQKELVSYQGTISMKMQEETVSRMSRLQLNQVKAKKPKTREEAQKEILDAELDLFTKQQEGQDVTELMKRIDELRRNMTIQFPAHNPAVRRSHPRGGGKFNPALRFTRSGPGVPLKFGSASVDHRPRALLISGFEADELEGLYAHFSQYGEVISKEVDLTVPQLVLQYKARAHASQAMTHGKHYNERTLAITWATNQKPVSSAPPAPAEKVHNGDVTNDEQKEEPTQSLSTDALLRFEEEEDEEREDRSWRR